MKSKATAPAARIAVPHEGPAAPVPLFAERWPHRLIVPGLLLLTAALAISSLVRDSSTFDETSHLTTGVSYWKTGDFRYTPDHPPLGKLWAALPLLFVPHTWPGPEARGWASVDSFELGRVWLFELNDGQRLLIIGRGMVVLLLLGTCLLVYLLARRLWGPTGGLLALVLAGLSPTLLAHGRLVTTDTPIAFCTVATLLAFARLAERLTWDRMVLAAVALGASSIAKMSWPLILPALLVMAAGVLLRRQPWPTALRLPGRAPVTALVGRSRRGGALLGVGLLCGLVIFVAIWTAFGWRHAMLAPLPADAAPEIRAGWDQARAKLANDRQKTALGMSPAARPGPLPGLLRFVDRHRLLPEGYVLGLAQTAEFTANRRAYLMGEYSGTGWRLYFPIAFALKTPVASQLLIIAAIAALLVRRAAARDPVLLAGLLVFAVLYATNAIRSNLNIGHRHLLPLYPVVFVLAGAAAAWLTLRPARWVMGAALAWLLGANLWVYPHYLSYFNELIGGPRRGHLYLADSNLDWGQDLLYLAEYSRRFPDQEVKLAYFGSARPQYYVPCAALPSHHKFEPPAELTGGLYAISATQLVSVYDERTRDDFWTDPQTRAQYANLTRLLRDHSPDEINQVTSYERAVRALRELSARRLIQQLRHRAPDARAGYSIFLYHLSDEQVQQLIAPGPA